MIARFLEPRFVRKWLLLLLVAGMSCQGREFAYLGLNQLTGLPVYVTEIVLGVSLYLGFLGYCTVPALRERIRASVNAPLLLYWLWGLMLLVPALPAYGFDAVRDFVVVYYSLFIFVTVVALRSLDDTRHLLYVLVAANMVFVGRVLLRVVQGDFDVRGIYLRLGGGTQGLYAIIAFVAVLTTYLAGARSDLRRRWLLPLLPFLVIGILAPQHRTLLLAFGGALGVLFLFLPQWSRPRLVALLSIALVCVSIVIVVVPNGMAVLTGQLPKYIAFFDLQEGSIAARLVNYQRAVDAIADSPIWGVGYGTALYFDYGNPQLDAPVRAPHNSYIGIAYRSGLVGLALFLVFLMWFYVQAARKIMKTTDGSLRSYAACLLAAQTAVAIMAIFNVTLEGPHEGIIFWILIGAELRVLQLAEETNGTQALTMATKAASAFVPASASSATASGQRVGIDRASPGLQR